VSRDGRAGEQEEEVSRVVRRASIAAASVAAALSPIPFADEVALLPVYAWLAVRIARARGVGARAMPWWPLTKTALVGLGVRAAVNAPLAGVPGVAAATNATSAVFFTRLYAAHVDRACRASVEQPPVRAAEEVLRRVTVFARRATRSVRGSSSESIGT